VDRVHYRDEGGNRSFVAAGYCVGAFRFAGRVFTAEQSVGKEKTMTTNETPEKASETIRSYLHATLEHLLAAGRSTHDFVEFALAKFGKHIIPHLKGLQEDIQERRVNIANLADSARTAVFGIHVTAEQREQMVREAAYLRAQHRGYAGGSAEEDWYAAEQEIDALLAKQAGLLEKSRETFTSAATTTEKEMAHVKEAVADWIASHTGTGKKAA
jgi:hypothetical protein